MTNEVVLVLDKLIELKAEIALFIGLLANVLLQSQSKKNQVKRVNKRK